MLWWKHLESTQINVMMIEREEQRNREYCEHTTLTLTLPSRDPVLEDNFLLANLEQVRRLQASLFPICTKGMIKIILPGLNSFSSWHRTRHGNM